MDWELNVWSILVVPIAIPVFLFVVRFMGGAKAFSPIRYRYLCRFRNSHNWRFKAYKQPKATFRCVRCQKQKEMVVPPSPPMYMIPGGKDDFDEWIKEIVARANQDQ